LFQQLYEPVGNLAVSTLIAAIPIIVLFVLLAGIRMAAQWASLITLAVALVIAVLVYQMPLGLALNATLLGICFGLFPIVWIVINAIFIYNVIVDTGLFNTIRDSLAGVSNDRRIQVVLIAFVFGALLEATAGFGTPVAITASLMAGLGFEAIYAAALALLANTAPVAFGGFGIPIITGASVAGLDVLELSQMVGRQTPVLAVIIPGMLVTVMAGFRRMLEVWPVVVVSGVAFAGTQFVVSNVLGPELADLLAAIVTVVLAPLDGVALRERARRLGEGVLRDAAARTHDLRVVAVPHHRRALPGRPDTAHKGRHRRHPDGHKLPDRRG
jgi:lactate permease